MKRIILSALLAAITSLTAEESNTRGATETTPALAQYFSWIDNGNEGATESQTIANLEFFKWLHDEYGMKLDIYAFDAGIIDGPRYYGSIESEKFKSQMPNGFDPIHELAKSFGCRLGVWLGPDGYGDTPEEEKARREMLVKLCRDYDFALFKMDAVCTQLREEKQDAFARTMIECRKHSPDLILLNHRLNLGPAEPHATTFLWEGAETYIDVHMTNKDRTGSHNRVQAISRNLVPGLKRLTEDHGVCLSSCLDSWEDDLILQAFNRNLILSPQLYGSPWLLSDAEFPKMARIYNLARRYREILVHGMVLDEKRYGPLAVARGSGDTRLVTMRNLEWETSLRTVKLDESIGLAKGEAVEVRQFHPTERILGTFEYGEEVEIEVQPFRANLLLVDRKGTGGVGVIGCDYEVVRDVPGKPVEIKLLGAAGSENRIQVVGADGITAVDGKPLPGTPATELTTRFDGKPLEQAWHRKLGAPAVIKVPADAEQLYEATCFASDNNSHEIRALRRSGPTSIPQVRKARQEYLEQPLMAARGILQEQLTDGDTETHLHLNRVGGRYDGLRHLRLDLGEVMAVDALVFRLAYEEMPVFQPELPVAEVSADLKTWKPVFLRRRGIEMVLDVDRREPMRYVRSEWLPERVTEIRAIDAQGKDLDLKDLKLTWLFPEPREPAKAWSLPFKLEEAAPGSYLAVACNGMHGVEGAWMAMRVDGEIVGAPLRAPSFPVNPFESGVRKTDKNYTYFIPVTDEMIGKDCEVVVLGLDPEHLDFQPEVWLTAYPIPLVPRTITLTR